RSPASSTQCPSLAHADASMVVQHSIKAKKNVRMGGGLSAYIGSAPTLRERRCAVKRNELHPAPSQIRSGAAQCAPRQAAAGTAGNREAGKNEKPLHRVLTFFETALRCAAPLA